MQSYEKEILNVAMKPSDVDRHNSVIKGMADVCMCWWNVNILPPRGPGSILAGTLAAPRIACVAI
ncbi:hypothetical protein E2C01_060425 [Portunus trituberculatus]|uniref:Uncharacterized protein n=1 Tax=Portunus trituberculatus TaxID=210409 RepID=A0A5B7HBD4_PORTR|nr:hypothetical protein [Portunus trituberculatus]